MPPQKFVGRHLGESWEKVGRELGNIWESFGIRLGKFWNRFWRHLGDFWKNLFKYMWQNEILPKIHGVFTRIFIYDKKRMMMKMYVNNGINDEIRFLAQSEIRLKILSELNKRPDNVRGLVKETKITYSSVSSNVSKLEENNYIRKFNGKYYVDPMARIYFKTLMDFKKSIEIIKDFHSFWYKHNLGQMSINSMRNINDLKNSKLIETTPLDIYKTHTTIKNQLFNSKDVKAIFPYLHPEYPKLLERILKNGGSIELILPREITSAIMRPIDETLKKNSIKKGKLKIRTVKEDLNLYLTICDKNMSLGLFKTDGSFDQNRILVSKDEKSCEWAEELFEYVKDKVI